MGAWLILRFFQVSWPAPLSLGIGVIVALGIGLALRLLSRLD
jgi:hypothetical protein